MSKINQIESQKNDQFSEIYEVLQSQKKNQEQN